MIKKLSIIIPVLILSVYFAPSVFAESWTGSTDFPHGKIFYSTDEDVIEICHNSDSNATVYAFPNQNYAPIQEYEIPLETVCIDVPISGLMEGPVEFPTVISFLLIDGEADVACSIYGLYNLSGCLYENRTEEQPIDVVSVAIVDSQPGPQVSMATQECETEFTYSGALKIFSREECYRPLDIYKNLLTELVFFLSPVAALRAFFG